MQYFPHVFVAGTFDGLHKGHRFFLSKAFLLGKNVTIGLTSDRFQKKKSKFLVRKKALENWLKTKGLHAEIIPIHDAYEPAATYKESVALLVTPDNRDRGEEINEIRIKRGLQPFTLIEIPLVKAEDRKPISSTRVRRGEIDTEGRLVLPDNLRPELQKPLGVVLTSIKERKAACIIAVGDVTAKTLLDAGIQPELAIIDNKVERKPYTDAKKLLNTFIYRYIEVKSGPGFIAEKAIALIKESMKTPGTVIEVDGEEDLLALPAIVYAPPGAIVYYGQPQKGIVEVHVTKKTKRIAVALLSQFL